MTPTSTFDHFQPLFGEQAIVLSDYTLHILSDPEVQKRFGFTVSQLVDDGSGGSEERLFPHEPGAVYEATVRDIVLKYDPLHPPRTHTCELVGVSRGLRKRKTTVLYQFAGGVGERLQMMVETEHGEDGGINTIRVISAVVLKEAAEQIQPVDPLPGEDTAADGDPQQEGIPGIAGSWKGRRSAGVGNPE